MSAKKILPEDIRNQGDPKADSAFQYLYHDPQVYKEFLQISSNKTLVLFGENYKELTSFIDEIQLPGNVDHVRLKNGARFFEKNAQSILPILGFYSLPYCYAGARGARVLFHSKRLLNDPFNRLIETAQFVFDVCKSGAFEDYSNGLVSIAKVRLMHAAARHYTSKDITDETPVNQQDMIGTLLSFSLLVIRGLRKLGISMTKREIDGYVYLWNVIGAGLGIKLQYLPSSIAVASKLEAEIRKSEFIQSEEGIALTRALLLSYKASSPSMPLLNPADLVDFFLGEEVSKVLGIPSRAWKKDLIGLGLNVQSTISQFGDKHFREILKQFDLVKKENGINPAFKFAL